MNRILSKTEKNEEDRKIVFEKNMLFATLDVAQRSVILDSNHQFILIDTVGFVSKLPHSLVNAFKATLEEVTYADLLVHVVESSYENHDFHINVTDKVLAEIGAGGKERILAFNKIALVDPETVIPRPGTENIFISAKHDIHVDELLDMIRSKIFSDEVTCCMMIPYTRGDITSYLCDKAEVAVMDYQADGTYFKLTLKNADYQKYKEYEIDEII